MTVREYIGARYIPLYMGDWDDTKSYEPLSIVGYQGDSYTSRQYVPAGVSISNEEYWAVTGNYNAQIEQYRQETNAVAQALPITDFDSTNTVKKAIQDATGDVGALLPSSNFDTTNTVKKYVDDVSALLPGANFDTTNTVKKYIDDADTAIKNLLPDSSFDTTNTVAAAISNEATARDNADTTLRNAIKAVGDNTYENLILIGDSFGAGTTPPYTQDSTKGWIYYAEHQIGNLYKNVYDNLGNIVPGNVGFTTASTVLANLQYIVNNYDVDTTLRTKIVVMCGTNERDETSSNIQNAIVSFMNYVNSTFSKPTVFIGALSTYINKMVDNGVGPAYKLGCLQCDNANYMQSCERLMALKSQISSDGTHLTESGYAFYSPWTTQLVLNGVTDYFFYMYQQLSVASGMASKYSVGHPIYIFQYNSPTEQGTSLERFGSAGLADLDWVNTPPSGQYYYSTSYINSLNDTIFTNCSMLNLAYPNSSIGTFGFLCYLGSDALQAITNVGLIQWDGSNNIKFVADHTKISWTIKLMIYHNASHA